MKKYILGNYKNIFCILLIIAIATLSRLILNTAPPNINGDEVTNLSDIYKILYQPGNHLLSFFGDGSVAGINFYPVAIFIKLFGVNQSIYYFRFFISICSILSLIPFFFLLKKATNNLVSFLFTSLLSANYVFLNFSITAWVNMISIFWITSLILCFEYALSKKNRILFIVSGAVAGITLYGYHYGRFFAIMLYLLLFLYYLFKKNLSYLKNIFISFFVCILIFLPFLIQIILGQGEAVLRRPAATFVFKTEIINNQHDLTNLLNFQIKKTITGFLFLDQNRTEYGIENSRYVPIGFSPVNNVIKFMFFLGMIPFIYNWKKYKLLYLIIFSVIFIQIITQDPPNFSRGLIYIAVIYFIAALPLNWLFNFLNQHINLKFGFAFCLIFATIFLFYLDTNTYYAWMNNHILDIARQPAISYYEFPYWQKYQIKRIEQGLEPIVNYEWYRIRSIYLPNK